MKRLASFLVVLGVCLGALGAAGYHTPYDEAEPESGSPPRTEEHALTFFFVGLLALLAGGIIGKRARRPAAAQDGTLHLELQTYTDGLQAVRSVVQELDDRKAELTPAELRERLGRLLGEELFDLTSKSDELVLLIGFSDYARIWDGIAVAERLLNRSWSLLTDEYVDAGRAELPLARENLDRAAAALASD